MEGAKKEGGDPGFPPLSMNETLSLDALNIKLLELSASAIFAGLKQ